MRVVRVDDENTLVLIRADHTATSAASYDTATLRPRNRRDLEICTDNEKATTLIIMAMSTNSMMHHRLMLTMTPMTTVMPNG